MGGHKTMKKQLRAWGCALLALSFLPLAGCTGGTGDPGTDSSAQAPQESETTAAEETTLTEETTEPAVLPEVFEDYRIGTLNAADGLANTSNKKRFYNDAFNALSDVTGVTVGRGYELTWLAYDGAKKYLGNGNDYSGYWQGDGVFFTSAEILRIYPQAVYFRFAVKNIGGTEIKMTDVEKSGVEIVPAGRAIAAENFTNTFAYTGSGLSENKTISLTVVDSVRGGQDGAVWGDLLFRFDSKGNGTVTRLPDCTEVGTFTLGGTDVICPHSNAVSFSGVKYAPDDEFPLMYSNVYNTYSAQADRREGYCCVYRITRSGEKFTGELVQVLRIGFVSDGTLWRSFESGADVRPYGNFVVDAERGRLWAFVMRDKEKKTRFFSFDLPDVRAGEDGILPGVKVYTLTKEAILKQFDTEYINYMQGACMRDGLIYSVEGFTDAKKDSAPALRVIDTERGVQIAFADLYAHGFRIEPELVTFMGDTLLYSDNKGKLFSVSWGK